MAHRVGIMGGDGIGPEVIAEGLKVIAAVGVEMDTVEYDLGGERYMKDGTILPDEIVEEWRGLDALYAGAVGSPGVPPGVIERGLLLKMRFDLDLFINLRPFVTPTHDFVVIRENTEGTYAGEGGFLRKNTPEEVATQGSVNTRHGVERACRYAFELAMTRNKHVTLIHKTNVLTYSGDLWDRTFNEVAAEYPEVDTWYNHIDAACIYMVEGPERYDVIVTDNLFGDIITDLAGAISGGIGLAPTANLHPGKMSMFEPVHGSAPDIVGTGKANPIAAILSGAMMLDHLGEIEAADRIRAACAAPETLTGSTSEIGDAVVGRL